MTLANLALVHERIELTTARSVEEVQRRLATATAGWSGDHFGRAVPGPPWAADGRFVACEPTESFWLSLPVVVAGEVRPDGAGARLTAVIRPHRAAVAPYAVTGAFLAGSALARGAPLFGVLWLVLVGAVAIFNLSASVAERAPALRAVLASACGAPSAGSGARLERA